MANFNPIFVKGLSDENPWWFDKEPPIRPSQFKRSDYYALEHELNSTGAYVLIGPRRVGKSELLRQLIEELTIRGVPGRRILFVSLERPYMGLVQNGLLDVLEYYEQFVLKDRITQDSEKIYLFIDEAQYDSAWTRLIKQFVDQKKNIFCVVTGSSSTALFKDTRESGAGRLHTRHMLTMKFRDVLRLRNPSHDQLIMGLSKKLRDAFVLSVNTRTPGIYEDALREVQLELIGNNVVVEPVLEEYLLKGGYPEFYNDAKPWIEIKNHYQSDVFDAIINKDVVNVFAIKHPLRLRTLLLQILSLSGSVQSRSNLADALQLGGSLANRLKIIDQYIEALSDAFLIRTAVRYTGTRGRPSTSERKYFAADVGLRNVVLGVQPQFMSDHERGLLVETAVFDHSQRLGFHADKQIRMQGYYWKTDRYDIDTVLDMRVSHRQVIPIEAKNGQCDVGDKAKVRRFVQGQPTAYGIIVCKNQLEYYDRVMAVPLHLFLLST